MSIEHARQELTGSLTGEVRVREPMSKHATFRIGGPADLYCVCDTLPDLSHALAVLSAEGVDHVVLGKGSNILVADEGYRGAVLVLGRDFRRHRFTDDNIEAGAACVLAALVQEAYGKGLSGLEFAVGIPGTLGGALAMNAGTRGEWIERAVESVTLYVPGEGLVMFRGGEVTWSYRRSDLPDRGVIVEAVLSVRPGDPITIRRVMEANFLRRKKTQPVGMPSAGSVFVNPEGVAAGALIEEVGLKGVAVGGAAISEHHANFIVNTGSGTASDVARLVRLVRDKVRLERGVELLPEIRFIGDFPAEQA